MLDQMSASEHASWEAFFTIEPMPAMRADVRAAEIIRAIVWAAGAKHVPALSRLVPDWWHDRTQAKQSPAQMKANLDLIKALRGKRAKNAT